MHFYELLAEFNEPAKKELRILYKEANEMLSIIVASINTSLKNMKKSGPEEIRNRPSKI